MGNQPSSSDTVYCRECGQEILPEDQFCVNCGTEQSAVSPPQQQSTSHNTPRQSGKQPPTQQPRKDQPPAQRRQQRRQDSYREAWLDNTWFKMTAFLAAGLVIVLILAVTVSAVFGGLVLVSFIWSLLTMGVDLRQLPDQIADTPWYLWVVAAILLYIVVMPWYLYARKNYQPGPPEGPDNAGMR